MKEEKNPKVSILIQTYNRADILKDALNSAKNQTYKNLEILIGDNCSEDDTENVCRNEQEKDDRIKYFRHEKNRGMTANANFLLKQVSGDFFVWLNDDDWLSLDYVEKCFKFLEKRPDYSFAAGRTRLFTPDKKYIRSCKLEKYPQEEAKDRIAKFISTTFLTDCPTGLFRSKYIKELCGTTEDNFLKYRYHEDVLFMLKYLSFGKAKILGNTFLNKRENGATRDLANTSSDVFDTKGFTADNFYQKLSEIYVNAFYNDYTFRKNLSEEDKLFFSKETLNLLNQNNKTPFYKKLKRCTIRKMLVIIKCLV